MRATYTITALFLIVLGCAAPVERVYAQSSATEFVPNWIEEYRKSLEKERKEKQDKEWLQNELGGGSGGYSDGDGTVKEFVGEVFTQLIAEAIRERMEQLERQKREESEKAAK